MKYYKIQFAPYEPFKKNYLYYRDGEFSLVGMNAGMFFSEDQIENNKKLKQFLTDKEYQIHLQEKVYDVLRFRG